MTRKRILLVQPSIQPPGGGNAVAAWILQALAKDHDVDVLTWTPADVAPMNAYYGTSVDAGDISATCVSPLLRRIVDAIPVPSVLLKMSILFRIAKQRTNPYDVIICGHNETSFGRNCVQYLHYPTRLRPRPPADLRWYHPAPLLALYYAICDRLDPFMPAEVADATTLTNSAWTADKVRLLTPLVRNLKVVYPPVIRHIPAPPWAERANGFVCIGRLAPEKRIERVIGIMSEVHRLVPDVRLHIIGSRGPWAYGRRVERAVRAHGDWVTLHRDASRARLLELITGNRYAIHGMDDEHFGIAPAEAVAGGCIVFVPDSGGQVEIVGNDQRLVYRDDADAVAKIVRVLGDADAQRDIRASFDGRASMFSQERFMAEIREVVEQIGRKSTVAAVFPERRSATA